MKEAQFYVKLDRMKVQCKLCPNNCVILHGKRGTCGVRENISGVLYSLLYGKPCSLAVDPIEKKPLFHFLPKSPIMSIATAGCNLKCEFCQNWGISQCGPEGVTSQKMSPQEVVDAAVKAECSSIAYTYVEPTIFYEYMYEIAKLAHKAGLKNVIVSNGYINPAPLRKLCRYIDAANIDIKSFSDEFYKKSCGARLKPVLESIKILHKEKVWLELTTLVIPGMNDDAKVLSDEFEWIVANVGKDVPVHISRFFPSYKLAHLDPTPQSTLENAFELAKKSGLRYVYMGNIDVAGREDTHCWKCGKKNISRTRYYDVKQNKVKDGKCCSCGTKIAGVWKK